MKKINNITEIENTDNTLVVMFGIPGCGKSYASEKIAEMNESTFVMSSDAIREELYGTAACQDDPNRVFNILQQRATDHLKKGDSVIIDATALIKKYRVSNLKVYKDRYKRAICVVCATDLDVVFKQNNERDRHVPEEVINRMFKTMAFPRDEEGWDEIYILQHPNNKKTLDDYLEACKGIDHNNPHHLLNIYDHMIACYTYLATSYPDDKLLLTAAKFHDIGKPLVKTNMVRRGKDWIEDTKSHYLGHADVGAYFAACSPDPRATVDLIRLIGYHMEKFANKDWDKNFEELYPDLYPTYVKLCHGDTVCDAESVG